MNAIDYLARFAVSATADDGLRAVIAPAVADCLGCIHAGAESDVAQRVTRAFSAHSAGDALVIGTRARQSAPVAALINAVAGHAWDLDDWEEPGNTHPSVVLLPALFAASHITAASGMEVLSAYAVGAEIIMRLGETVSLDHYARGFHSTATLGVIGVAGAVARLLRLSPQQTAHALALSVSQATGYTLQFGSNAKPLQAGWAARNGLEAALLAAQGVTAQAHVLDNARGFAGLMGQLDAARCARVMAKLGAPWALLEYGLVMKPWPSCGYTHRLMTAALEVRVRLAKHPSHIVRIEARLPDFHAAILPFDKPVSSGEALFSVPACVGQMLVAGNLALKHLDDRFWEHPQVARLIYLTRVTAETAKRPGMNYDPVQPDVLRASLDDGTAINVQCPYPLGAAQNPMTHAQLSAKYAELTAQPPSTFSELVKWPDAPDFAMFVEEHCHADT